MITFGSFHGVVTMIDDFGIATGESAGCFKLMTVQNNEGGIVNFVITPTTYFVDHAIIEVGDRVIGFFDAKAPVPLIYPPQYKAVVMAKIVPGINVKVDYFDENLLSSDNTLKLNIAPFTGILLENGQVFTGNPGNHNLIVIYGATTRSIPAQTTPYKIVVLCPKT